MFRLFGHYVSITAVTVIIGDTLLLIVSTYLALRLRLFIEPIWFTSFEPILPKSLVWAACVQVFLFLAGLYDFEEDREHKERVVRIGSALVVSAGCLAALYYLLPGLALGRGIFLIALLMAGVLLLLWRITVDWILESPPLIRRLLVVGAGPLALMVERVIFDNGSAPRGFQLVGFARGTETTVPQVETSKILGSVDNLYDLAVHNKVRKIVVAADERRGTLSLEKILECKMRGIEVVDVLSFYEQCTGKVPVERLRPSWLIFSDGFRKNKITIALKRVMDSLLAIVGLSLTAPIFVLMALAIRLNSKGHVLYRQERVGENGKVFTLYKFRTMVEDAEQHSGPVWASMDDPRITRVGFWLRKCRIDELPQLINVLRGEMSFVGPRPERPCFIEQLKARIPYYAQRHTVKPGITGWAQVRYRYGATVEDALEKLQYDLYYIKNLSIFLDLVIMVETFRVVLFGKGAR